MGLTPRNFFDELHFLRRHVRVKSTPLRWHTARDPTTSLTGDGGGSNVHVQHLCEDFEAIVGNAGRCHGTLLVGDQEVSCRVDTTLHDHHVAVGRELASISPVGDDVGDGNAAAVAAEQSPDKTGAADGDWAPLEAERCLKGWRSVQVPGRMEEDVADTGQIDADLIRTKKVGLLACAHHDLCLGVLTVVWWGARTPPASLG